MRRLAVLLLACVCGGCVERTLTVTSTPPDALVYLNDQEVGRTPFKKRFLWYGWYDVQVRKTGYKTLKTSSAVIAPWWQWIPFDFVAEVLPIRFPDDHPLTYHLEPLSQAQVDPEAISDRGQALREKLESSRMPQPATKPTTGRAVK